MKNWTPIQASTAFRWTTTTHAARASQNLKGGSFLFESVAPEQIFTPEDFTDEHRDIAPHDRGVLR